MVKARTRSGAWLAAGAASGALALSAMADPMAYPAEGFDQIDLSAGLSVIYETGDTHSVVADFQRGGPDDVYVDVEGDTLVIRRKNTGWNWGGNRVNATFTVTSPNLEGVEASSGSTFTGTGIDADRFSVDVSSGATVMVEGRCNVLSLDASSGASADTADLQCADGVIDTSSGASASAAISETVTVDASSGSSVRVSGNPEVLDLDRSSGASVNIEPGAL